jgi:hypothetical protein
MATNKKTLINEGLNVPADLGSVPAELATKLTTADPLEQTPTFVPNKPGFEAGATLGGVYIRTKRVYSDKLMGGKRDDAGKKYRELHILRDSKGRHFGIWGVGQLDWAFARIAPGQYIAVTYEGMVGKPLRPGQSAPHAFTFKGVDLHFDYVAPQAAIETGANVPDDVL